MSGEKTEEPTHKKLQDSAEKGQSYKSRDIVAATIIFFGLLGLSTIHLSEIGELFKEFIARGDAINTSYVVERFFTLFLKLTLPFIGVCIVATVIPSLIQSKLVLAFKALELKFDSLNPVNGFKKIFSMKTVKEFVKALLYLTLFLCVTYSFFKFYQHVLLGLVYVQTTAIAKIWFQTFTTLVLLCLLSFVIIIVIDGLADYFLYLKDLKMDKHEVKQEHKEQEGNAEMKSHRKVMHKELLSAQEKNDIEGSNFVLANPTHIAIGIYANFKVTALPFISFTAQGEKAQAIIKYAEKHGTPVVRDILVARKMYKTAKRYEFIPLEMIEPIFRILLWLLEINATQMASAVPEVPKEQQP
jgi:type III secretion protein U